MGLTGSRLLLDRGGGLGTNRRLLTLRGLARLGGAKALLFVGALRVEDEEAIDDGVLELLNGAMLLRGAGAERRDGRNGQAVSIDDRAVHCFVERAQFEDARLVAPWIPEMVIGLRETLVDVRHVRGPRGVARRWPRPSGFGAPVGLREGKVSKQSLAE